MSTTATILAGTAVLISGGTAMAILTLMDRKPFHYDSSEDLAGLRNRVDLLGENQALIWRYVEAVDDRCDLAGLPVLRPSVPGDKATADW